MEYLTVNELQKLRSNHQVAHPLSRLAFLFACYTGLQPEDIHSLQFDHIHHSGSGLTVALRNIRVPLGRMAMFIFREISALYANLPTERQDGHLFSSLGRETMDEDIREWVYLVGIQRDIDLSSGRPTFCMLALQAGVSPEELASWCGCDPKDLDKYRSLTGASRTERDIEAFDALFAPYLRQELC